MKDDIVMKYLKTNISLHKLLLNDLEKKSEEEKNHIISIIKECRCKIRDITGDYKKTKIRWDARKEKRKLQELYKNENLTSFSKKMRM